MVAPSCSLLHSPCDLSFEKDEAALPREVKRWLAFDRQKLDEVVALAGLAMSATHRRFAKRLAKNIEDNQNRKHSSLIYKSHVKERLETVGDSQVHRSSPFTVRQKKQRTALRLPVFPTTTIGSFPQTAEIRRLR